MGNTSIGERIRIARIKVNVTQKELAELIKRDPTTISKIETGAAKPSLGTLNDIANVLNTTPSALLESDILESEVCNEQRGIERSIKAVSN